MPWTVIQHESVVEWQMALSPRDYVAVQAAIHHLELHGPSLGRPLVDSIKGSRMKNLKELRSLGTSMRLLFAFDSRRRAVVVVAGDKQGQWDSWYRRHIPIAEQRFSQWVKEGHQ